jgi:sortase A
VTKRTKSPVRAVLRFIASVMMVSGVLLIADAAITLAWQEPVSAFLVQHQQAVLKHKLEHPPKRVFERHPLKGDSIGKIILPAIHRSYYMVEGTDLDDLRKGPGHYHDTPLPGQHGTVAVAGHRTTHGAPFRHIDQLKRGQRIILEMPYGTYTYLVQKTKIVDPTDLSVLRRVGYDRLILSACHPLYSAAQRIVVFARFARHSRAVVARK